MPPLRLIPFKNGVYSLRNEPAPFKRSSNEKGVKYFHMRIINLEIQKDKQNKLIYAYFQFRIWTQT